MKLLSLICLIFLSPNIVYATQQTVEDGGTGVIHTGSGNINIPGYTKEKHQHILNREKARLRKDLERFHKSQNKSLQLEKQLLEIKLDEVETQLGNLERSYQERIEFLKGIIFELRSFQGSVKDKLLTNAEIALQQGDASKADVLFEQIEKQERTSIQRAAKAAFKRGKIAEDSFNYVSAFKHYERAVGLEPDNPLYLSTAGSMAGIMAQHLKEIEWAAKALEIYLANEGEDSAQVATTRNNLGLAYQSLGEYGKAIEYYQLALASDLKTYGEDHSSVATMRNNLGGAYDSLGQYNKAIELYQLALKTYLRIYGEKHPEVAKIRNNLGAVYSSLGQYDKAIEYFQLTLDSFLKIFGENHPKVATARNNMGLAYDSLGQYNKAIELYQLALTSDLKTYGEDHPSVATRRSNLGSAYKSLGQYNKAPLNSTSWRWPVVLRPMVKTIPRWPQGTITWVQPIRLWASMAKPLNTFRRHWTLQTTWK